MTLWVSALWKRTFHEAWRALVEWISTLRQGLKVWESSIAKEIMMVLPIEGLDAPHNWALAWVNKGYERIVPISSIGATWETRGWLQHGALV